MTQKTSRLEPIVADLPLSLRYIDVRDSPVSKTLSTLIFFPKLTKIWPNTRMWCGNRSHIWDHSRKAVNGFPDKRVLVGMMEISTCKNKKGIGIWKGFLSEIQIWNIAKKITMKKARERSKIDFTSRGARTLMAEVTSIYHCVLSGSDWLGMK
jgi:hypothetical protein